jgi:hypothetical protein
MSNTLTGRTLWRVLGIALGVSAVVLVAVIVHLDRPRYHVVNEGQLYEMRPVLVAKQLIPKGTPALIIASQSMYQKTTLPPKELEVGAISDPAYLRGRATAVDIDPGQQFTTTKFAP